MLVVIKVQDMLRAQSIIFLKGEGTVKKKMKICFCALLCVALIVPAAASAKTTPYRQLQLRVLVADDLMDIAEKKYTNSVAPLLIGDKKDMIGYAISDEDINSAEIIGPFPIFYLAKRVTVNGDSEVFLEAFKGGSEWAFIAVAKGKGIAYFVIEKDKELFRLTSTYSSTLADFAYQVHLAMEEDNSSSKIIVNIGATRFFLDENDRLQCVASVEDYPPITFEELMRANDLATAYANQKAVLPEGGPTIMDFLFEDKAAYSHNRNLFFVLAGSFVVLVLGLGTLTYASRRKVIVK